MTGRSAAGFEAFLETLDLMNPEVKLMALDEIGKMECFSIRFRDLVYNALSSDKQMLTTIPIQHNEFVREIKQWVDMHLFEVTWDNRDHLPHAAVEGF